MPLPPAWTAIPVVLTTFLALAFLLPDLSWERDIRVAFVGNSVQFTNDLPRLMQALSARKIKQESCLNAFATIQNMWYGGNGMFGKFSTPNALIRQTISTSKRIFDYGACSTIQLLTGTDERLIQGGGDFNDVNDNPCLQDENYLYYALNKFRRYEDRTIDFVVINDETRNPARKSSRQSAMYALTRYFAPWLDNRETTIPVFIATHAYWSEYRDMGGLVDVPTFTSLTYEGYKQFASLLNEFLPPDRQTRIAPVGIAFLLVYEDNYGMWERLFHYDNVHLSPHGTYLMGIVLYYTLYQHMPRPSIALPESISTLFAKARRMQSPIHHSVPMPSQQEAMYLYNIAERVCRKGHLPESFISYKNGEAADYVPEQQEKEYDYYKDEAEYYYDYLHRFEDDDNR